MDDIGLSDYFKTLAANGFQTSINLPSLPSPTNQWADNLYTFINDQFEDNEIGTMDPVVSGTNMKLAFLSEQPLVQANVEKLLRKTLDIWSKQMVENYVAEHGIDSEEAMTLFHAEVESFGKLEVTASGEEKPTTGL